MSTVAHITLTDGQVTADSHIWIIQDGVFEVTSGPVPEPNGVTAGLRSLGWRPVCYDGWRQIPNGVEIDVEPIEGDVR